MPEAERQQFADRWTSVQSLFVDNPKSVVTQADRLSMEVMQARGYATGDFEPRASDSSVDHPVLVENYRVAPDIALRHDNKGAANTEDLRRAMIHYRALFEDLLQSSTAERRVIG